MSAHVHPCNHCKTPVECHGEPVADDKHGPLCHVYHIGNGLFLCDDCESAFLRGDCHTCGEPAVMTLEDRGDDATGYRGDAAFCQECWDKRMERLR